MYHLLTGLVKHLTRKEEFNVIILGLDNAGKTTFLERVKDNFTDTPGLSADKIAPTIGQNISRVTLSSSVLQFWDLGGQRDMRTIWSKYYAESDAVVFVIDSTDPQRFDECWQVFETVVADRRVDGAPILVLANKRDSDQCVQVEEIKERFNRQVEAMNISEGLVMPISALRGEGIREAVNWLFFRV
ncbi:uncharacterized protein L969DRAFT_27371, partial [Mixia osmundae IAM 14324]|uniref:uncharacterized protein n=1 Tax=Mixia osmundae (strain CBS 9802 / IAM 14324 / JCM 22182 / KY 12970) TaxID=764103 RepID=UPI0004A555E6